MRQCQVKNQLSKDRLEGGILSQIKPNEIENSEKTKNKIENLKNELYRLNDDKKAIIEEISRLEKEYNKFKETRSFLNEEFRIIIEKAKEQREKRDMINDKVSYNKKLREEKKKELTNLKIKIDSLKKEIGDQGNRFKKSDAELIEKRIEEIEWKIQTSPMLELDEEKKLIDTISEMAEELEIYKEVMKKNDNLMELLSKLNKVKDEISFYHSNVEEFAKLSEQHHNRMKELYEEASKIKEKADEAHQSLLKKREELRTKREKLKELNAKIREIDKNLKDALIQDKVKKN